MSESAGSGGAGNRPADDHAWQRDEGSIVPSPLPDAPAYIPAPVGMTTGGIMSPPDPAEVPTSAWITTAPQSASGRGGRSASVIGIIASVIGIIVVAAVIAGVLGLFPSDKGKILFGTAAGKDLCSVGSPTTTVKTTDPIFFTAILKEHLDGQQAIVFYITKDGVDFLKHDEPADGKPFDCYGNKESLGALAAGNYVFEVLHNNDVEAKGSLTVQ